LNPNALIDFLSRECRNKNHQGCAGGWSGLGIDVACNCNCGHRKNADALDKVGRPGSNATPCLEPSSQEVINLRTLMTLPHSPDFMSTIQIPVKYDINNGSFADFFEWVGDNIGCPCPAIMRFMHEVMSDDDVETVLDMIAYCLWRGFPFHRYMLFNGSGRNGKGVILEVIRRFLGIRNVSGESLHQILTNRFSVARLFGKIANMDAVLSKDALNNTGILKKLTGGDLIRAEDKFMAPFDFVNHAKLFFSTNEFPTTKDETDAFFARLIIINFPNQFLGDKADPQLIEKLTTEAELSGLLKVVLRRLPRVLTKGIQTTSSTIDENYTKYILSSDPIRAFVETALESDLDINTLKTEIYESYKMFCRAKNLSPVSEGAFSRRMTRQHGIKCEQFRDGKGRRPYYYLGVKIRDWKAAEQGQSTL
jgi:P4 family phage/plasmid primase-like protien